MAKQSNIQWTNATWNPFMGCKKVSEGCRVCYAERLMERYGNKFRDIKKASSNTLYSPRTWKEPKMIFTCSLSDFFLMEADQWRHELWDIIKNTPHHTYQILTKRPERILQSLPPDWGQGYPNVWIGTSVENQKLADERLPIIASIPAVCRWISAEPLLEPIDLSNYIKIIDWICVGGESAFDYNYSECKIEWIENIVRQGKKNNIPVFVKQLGCYIAKLTPGFHAKDWKGEDINEFPESLRVREFPEIIKHSQQPTLF